MHLKDLPALGQPLEGGTFAGLTTRPDGTHHAVVLLADTPGSRLTWAQATEWAGSLNAQLPSRPVAALLFANAKAAFEEAWHWTADEDPEDSAYAWFQGFDGGYQYINHKSYEGRARAVRLIQLTT